MIMQTQVGYNVADSAVANMDPYSACIRVFILFCALAEKTSHYKRLYDLSM